MSALDDINLNNLTAEQVELLCRRLRDQNAARNAAPRLHRAILRRLEEALTEGRVSSEVAVAIGDEMKWCHPAVVLQAHWHELVKNRPAVGSFPRPALPKPHSLTEQIAANPRRELTSLVEQMWRFRRDPTAVAGAAAEVADAAGVPQASADRIIAEALQRLLARGAGRAC